LAGDKKQEQHVYWVNSTKVSCVGLAPSKCLQIQKSATMDPSAWETFYASIKGFEYEPGYIYKIVVKENHIDPVDLPADASSTEYTLVEILEKRQDMKFRINDIWVAVEINGETLHVDGISLPQLEIKVGEMHYMGSDELDNQREQTAPVQCGWQGTDAVKENRLVPLHNLAGQIALPVGNGM
jgi:hypothetical protein